MAVLDGDLRVADFNEPFRAAFDLGSNEESGARLIDLVPDGMLEAIVRDAMDDGQVAAEEFGWSGEGGGQRTFLLSVSPYGSEPGTHLLTFHDVTRWKRRLQIKMDAGRLASLRHITAGIAHEVNNPLVAIMGLSQLASRRASDPLVLQDLDKINSEAQRVAEVMANLQVLGGVVNPRKTRVDLVPLLRRLVDVKSGGFQAAGLGITACVGRYELPVEGDAQ